eukprot:CAMPEP_0116136380 /NCGR_PEP_ID=MMETSP0329-20121206/11692_1 /TAXON_ID=697910 /ORGANISM="Pseudo-nitzschia arenysensis, Strain B593" /LENGTH=56 /DNA_ID=CAMNT_0003631241 /DNA_START=1199 /DNA_END=1366 /DNA_ORIENTATION=-
MPSNRIPSNWSSRRKRGKVIKSPLRLYEDPVPPAARQQHDYDAMNISAVWHVGSSA